jgi:hypothetical protein
VLTGLRALSHYARTAVDRRARAHDPRPTSRRTTLRKEPDVCSFPNIARRARHLSALSAPLAAKDAVELLCSDCPFYHPDREEQLECGSFLILKRLLERGLLTPAQIVAACG